ncbi:unnamed protein product, partial [Symbiodinium natans]
MEISDAAKSGDGTTTNVGIKMTGTFQCPECRQKFDSEKAKQLHWKFIHDPNRLGLQRLLGSEGWAREDPGRELEASTAQRAELGAELAKVQEQLQSAQAEMEQDQ